MVSEIEIDVPVSVLKGVKVIIPQNAFSKNTMITVSEVDECSPLPEGLACMGLLVDFGPAGIQFSKPIMIGIPYNQGQLSVKGSTGPHQLKAFHYSISDSCQSYSFYSIPIILFFRE